MMGKYSGGLLSSVVQVRGKLVDRRLGWVMGKYSGGPLSPGSAGRSSEVNEEAGRVESVSITGDGRVGGRERENILHKLYMMGHKYFFESDVKTEEDTE